MVESLTAALTSKNDQEACALAGKIIDESRLSPAWYPHFDEFTALLSHRNSFVRNRALHILAALAQWDEEGRFDTLLPHYLAHVTDEKPITARQCIQALSVVGAAKPQYIPQICSHLQNADLSKYRDSMRPLLEKDIAATTAALRRAQ